MYIVYTVMKQKNLRKTNYIQRNLNYKLSGMHKNNIYIIIFEQLNN